MPKTFGWTGAGTSRHYSWPKLTSAQRDEIGFRRMEGERLVDLACEYGVHVTVIDKCAKKERP